MERTSKRRRTRPNHRRPVYVPVAPSLTLADVLAIADRDQADRVWLVGPRPGRTPAAFMDWLTAVPDGWVPGPAGHYVADADAPVLRYRRQRDRHDVEILRAAMWLGDGDYSADQARDALDLMLSVIRGAWGDDQLELYRTPATMGRDLWQRTIPHGTGYPVLDWDVQDLLRTTSGQGRWEHFEPAADTAPALIDYDMRFGYAGLLWGLGVGNVEHVQGDGFTGDPMRRGWHRVVATVPDGWDRVGILPLAGERWTWPAEPGARFETWADGSELAVASRWGWSLEIGESYLFDAGRPLDVWARKLTAVRDDLERAVREDQADAAVAKLAADAVRQLVLTTVGAFTAQPHRVTHVVHDDDRAAMPREAMKPRRRGDWWVYETETAPRQPDLAHPEWAVAVWARCRARMADFPKAGTGALHVPRRHLVAIRQDALVVTDAPAGWDRKPGEGPAPVGHLRRVKEIPGPLPWPATKPELDRLLRERKEPPTTTTSAAPRETAPPVTQRCGYSPRPLGSGAAARLKAAGWTAGVTGVCVDPRCGYLTIWAAPDGSALHPPHDPRLQPGDQPEEGNDSCSEDEPSSSSQTCATTVAR